jgi:general secretion pathway protein L
MAGEFGDSLLRFPRWWFSELAGLVPGGLRRALREQNRWVVFDFSGRELTISRVAGQKTREAGRVDLSLDRSMQRSAVARIARRLDLRNATLVVRLAESHALRKVVELPLAAEENLRQVLGFEMDRQTPFKPSEVYFDCRVIDRDAERQRLRGEIVVVPRAVVDGALGTLGEWGLAPEVVDLAGGDGSELGQVNLLPEERTVGRRRSGGALKFLLAGIALGLMGAVIYIALERQAAVAAAMADRVTAAKVDAEAVSGLRQEIKRLVDDGRFLRDRKRDDVIMTTTLNELTRVLPDHTWVYQLRLNGGEVQVWGYSSAASEIVSLIEASPAFREVKFRSPVTRDARLGLERFNLSATMGPRQESGE